MATSSRYATARRRIRGVGAAERRQGYAWASLDPRERGYFGNQKNYREAMMGVADRQNAAAEAARQEALREKGRQEVIGLPQASPTPNTQPPADATPAVTPKVDLHRFNPERALTRELAQRVEREEAARNAARAKARARSATRSGGSARFDGGKTATQAGMAQSRAPVHQVDPDMAAKEAARAKARSQARRSKPVSPRPKPAASSAQSGAFDFPDPFPGANMDRAKHAAELHQQIAEARETQNAQRIKEMQRRAETDGARDAAAGMFTANRAEIIKKADERWKEKDRLELAVREGAERKYRAEGMSAEDAKRRSWEDYHADRKARRKMLEKYNY